ncbi:MAG TPA: GNAT family N-acetyltransferase [Terriglobales bacterium]|nr:GNAT family N-acetyltransferase [Terriglobales bacterium]
MSAKEVKAPMGVTTIALHAYPDPETESAWRRYLLNEPYASHYLAPDFFLEPLFESKRPFSILVKHDNAVAAVLTGIHEKTHVRCGNSASPQLSISPGCTAEDLRCLIEELYRETGRVEGCSLASFSRITDLKRHGFFERACRQVVMLDLRRGLDATYKGFNKGKRSDIQHAIKSGVEVIEATSDSDFESYYDIYAQWCNQKKLPLHPREMMIQAWRLESNRRLFLAVYRNKIVAGSVIRFLRGGIAEYAGNSSLAEYHSLRANPLLNWTAIQWAYNDGLHAFSMGGSHPYLKHFGGEQLPVYRYSTDASFFKTFQLREWLLEKRHTLKAMVTSRH